MATQRTPKLPVVERNPGSRVALAPSALVVAGAGCLSASAVFVKLAEVNAGTAAFLRCAIAMAALVPLAVRECRRHGRPGRAMQCCALAAGIFLGIDYALWTASILGVGAAIATVLNNVQVIAFPLLARIFGGTPIARRFLVACPVMLVGIALAGGALSEDQQVPHQLLGSVAGVASGIAYAAYLHLSRVSGTRYPRHVVTPVCVATGAATAVTGVIGAVTTGITVRLPAASWGWLAALALLGQVVAWLLLATASPKLAPGTSAALLLLHPVLAVALGLVVLRETPTPGQLAGCAVVIAAVWFANRAPRPRCSG